MIVVKKFIVKKRSFEAAARNPYRPRGQVRYGPWIKVGTHETFAEARAQLRAITGLWNTNIFYDGRKVLNDRCAVQLCVCGHFDDRGINWIKHGPHMERER